MGGTTLKFESWKVRIHTQNAPQSYFYCFLRDFWILKSCCCLERLIHAFIVIYNSKIKDALSVPTTSRSQRIMMVAGRVEHLIRDHPDERLWPLEDHFLFLFLSFPFIFQINEPLTEDHQSFNFRPVVLDSWGGPKRRVPHSATLQYHPWHAQNSYRRLWRHEIIWNHPKSLSDTTKTVGFASFHIPPFWVQSCPLTTWVVRGTWGMIQQRSSSSAFCGRLPWAVPARAGTSTLWTLSIQHFLCWQQHHLRC